MKFLLRMVVALSLLVGLGYGSYAFGLHVLSNHLFGRSLQSQNRNSAPKVSRSTLTGGAPRVEVEVLPAQNAGRGPSLPSTEVMSRRAQDIKPADDRTSLSRSRNLNQEDSADSNSDNSNAANSNAANPNPTPERTRNALGNRQFDDAYASDESSVRERDNTEEERPRRRRKRRKRRVTTTNPTQNQSTARAETSSSNDDTSNSQSSDSSDNSGGEDERPRRRRRIENSEPRREPARQERREPRRESPIPRPENSSGDSPIPQPE